MNKITYTKHCEFCGTEFTTLLSDDIRWVPEGYEDYSNQPGAWLNFRGDMITGLNILICQSTYGRFSRQHD